LSAWTVALVGLASSSWATRRGLTSPLVIVDYGVEDLGVGRAAPCGSADGEVEVAWPPNPKVTDAGTHGSGGVGGEAPWFPARVDPGSPSISTTPFVGVRTPSEMQQC
jgi:hypothetical protein